LGFLTAVIFEPPNDPERNLPVKSILYAPIVAAALAAPLAASAATAPAPLDEQWLQTSISGDRFEITGGKLALQRSTDPAVQKLARRLIADHSKSLREATSAARQFGVSVPPAPTPSMQWELHILRTLPAAQFNAEYAGLEVKDHNQDIEETGMEARKGQTVRLKQLARKDLPMLRMHLSMSRRAANSA
jgi:putative membrane protein